MGRTQTLHQFSISMYSNSWKFCNWCSAAWCTCTSGGWKRYRNWSRTQTYWWGSVESIHILAAINHKDMWQTKHQNAWQSTGTCTGNFRQLRGEGQSWLRLGQFDIPRTIRWSWFDECYSFRLGYHQPITTAVLHFWAVDIYHAGRKRVIKHNNYNCYVWRDNIRNKNILIGAERRWRNLFRCADAAQV